jgi:II/X family phage/plasmid replication protein
MIDWLTLRLSLDYFDMSTREQLRASSARICRIEPTGEIAWEIAARERLRSDTHSLTVRVGGDVEISGSPARLGQSNNVFGTGDILDCFSRMVSWASECMKLALPLNPELWRVTRVDVTHNYDLGDAASVRQALNYLRHAEGGRYQVKTSSESVYWSPKSRLRAGKAYHKGPHVRYQVEREQAELTDAQLALCDRILRLELRLGGQYWRERVDKKWYQWTEAEFDDVHREYFEKFIGDVEIAQVDDVLEKLKEVAPTEGQALAAYRTWLLVQERGLESARLLLPKNTFYRHKRVLNAAGLSWADFQARNIVPFRRKTIVLGDPVRSWEDFKKVVNR